MIALSRLTGISAGFAVGCILIVVGVYLLAGIPWTLIIAGVLITGIFLLVAPVDEPPPPAPRPDEESTQ